MLMYKVRRIFNFQGTFRNTFESGGRSKTVAIQIIGFDHNIFIYYLRR